MPLNYFLRTSDHFSKHTHSLALFLPKAEDSKMRMQSVCRQKPQDYLSPQLEEEHYAPSLNGNLLPFEVQMPLLILCRMIPLQHWHLLG